MEVNSVNTRNASTGTSAADAASAENAADIRHLVRELTLRQQKFERHLERKMRVDHAGLAVMEYLISHGPQTPTTLARQLDVSTAAMTLVLDRLEAAGHVSRERHPSDRRKVLITPSAESATRAYEYVEPLIAGVEEAINRLAPAEREIVQSFFAEFVSVYARVSEENAG